MDRLNRLLSTPRKTATLWAICAGAVAFAACAAPQQHHQSAPPSYRMLVRGEPGFNAPAVHAPHAERNLGAARVVPPYSLERVISTFGDCRGRRQHNGIDLAGVGDDAGLGTPIFSMTDAVVTLIGRPEDDPDAFGTYDKRPGHTERAGRLLPRSAEIPGYGKVYFFTRKPGRWRSGVVIATRALSGPLEGHQIRYMHMAAIHPSLAVGDLVLAGQEIGLMGGTAIATSSPHVHIDIEDPQGRRVDVAPFLGLEPDTKVCRPKR